MLKKCARWQVGYGFKNSPQFTTFHQGANSIRTLMEGSERYLTYLELNVRTPMSWS